MIDATGLSDHEKEIFIILYILFLFELKETPLKLPLKTGGLKVNTSSKCFFTTIYLLDI